MTQRLDLAKHYQDLILIANTTYEALVDSGKWLAIPPDDNALMTLMAKVDKLQLLGQRKESTTAQNKEGHWAKIVLRRRKRKGRRN